MKKMMFLAVLLSAVMVAKAETHYQKVTTAPKDWTGTYLIVCESQGVIFNGGADEDDLDAKGGPAIVSGVTFSGGTLVGSEAIDSATFTITRTDDDDWPWSIQSKSGFYIGHKDTVDNGLSVETKVKNKCKHTLNIEDGNLIATPRYEVSGEYNLQYNKKSDQQRFRYFIPNDKQAVQMYVLVTTPADLHSVDASSGSTEHARKIVRDGQLMIIKAGRIYNVLGI